MIDKTKLNINAAKNPSTANPKTNLSTKRIINALITRENNPRVRRVIGKVNKTKTGLIKVLINPKTTATIRAVYKSLR